MAALRTTAAGIGGITAMNVVAVVLGAAAHADPDTDANYLRVLHSHDITAESGSDQNLIDLGHKVCTALGDGYSMDALEDIGDIHERNGLSDDDVKIIVKAAAASYCPEYIQ